MHKVGYSVILGIFLLSCSPKPTALPEGVLEDSVMVKVIAEIELADAAIKILREDSLNKEVIYTEIYVRHHINEEVLKHSFQFYATEPRRLEAIYEKVIEKLTEEQAKGKEEK